MHEFVRRLIGLLIEDVIAETSRKLAALAPRSADDVRQAPSAVAGFSAGDGGGGPRHQELPARRGCIATPRVMRVMDEAAGVVRDLFARYSAHPDDLPAEWSEGLPGSKRRRAPAGSPISSPA